MSSPKISILTATFNALPELRETARSLDTQTFRDFEHIVVDGDSVDGTKDWLITRSEGIRWVSEPDSGIGDALNKGWRMASGDWILVLGAADTFASDSSLERAVAGLDLARDVVCHDVEFVMSTGTRRLVSRGLSPRLNFKPFPHQGAFTRRDLMERIGPFDASLRVHMDYEFYLRAYRAGATSSTHNWILSRMPDTGNSSRLDWPSLKERFAEERMIHERYSEGPGMRALYRVYWALYLRYREVRATLSGRGQR